MFNQISWDHFSKARHDTYQNLTLEFLRSFNYYTHRIEGRDRGRIVFRLFRHDYTFNHNEICEMLGFQTSQYTFTEVPSDNFMQYELNNLWGSITMEAPPDYERVNATIIHNPTIRYF